MANLPSEFNEAVIAHYAAGRGHMANASNALDVVELPSELQLLKGSALGDAITRYAEEIAKAAYLTGMDDALSDLDIDGSGSIIVMTETNTKAFAQFPPPPAAG